MITEDLYGRYLAALLVGDQPACAAIVTESLNGSIDVKTLYTNLMQRSMYEVGALWEANRISVATEHLATSVTEGLLSLVYPIIFARPHLNRTAIVSCVANEFHELGGRMVADIFELNGWHGHFLGANTPLPDLLAMISDKRPHLLALSMSTQAGTHALIAAVDAVRRQFPRLPVLVGGQAFRRGGGDIVQGYPGVQVVVSIHELETIIRARTTYPAA